MQQGCTPVNSPEGRRSVALLAARRWRLLDLLALKVQAPHALQLRVLQLPRGDSTTKGLGRLPSSYSGCAPSVLRALEPRA